MEEGLSCIFLTNVMEAGREILKIISLPIDAEALKLILSNPALSYVYIDKQLIQL